MGEIFAGIVLGPSVLGALWPDAFGQLFRLQTLPTMQTLAKVGIILLIFQVGMEFDFSHLRSRSRTVTAVSLMGIVAPALGGLLLGPWLHRHFVPEVNFVGFQLFVCIALAISALPMIAGRDGSTLRSVHRPRDAQSWWRYRWLARAGDVDGDGYPDYAAMRFDQTSGRLPDAVDVLSGRDDKVLWTVRATAWDAWFGVPVLLGDVDLNGDKRPDLLVGALTDPSGPAVYAYDHAGRLIYRLPYKTVSLGRIGDFDADGCDDFVMGLFDDNITEGGGCVVSGSTGKILVTGRGELPGDYLGGGMVSGCGDVDGDGVLDFAASSHGGFSAPGVVRVFSGRSGAALYAWRTAAWSYWGWSLAVGVERERACEGVAGRSGARRAWTGLTATTGT